MLYKLDPLNVTVAAPMERLDRGLDDHGRCVMRQLSEAVVEYMDHASFKKRGAEEQIFAQSIDPTVMSDTWNVILGDMESDEDPGQKYVLTAEEEKMLFLQYNYARFRVYRLMARSHKRRLSEKEAAEVVHWHDKSIEIRNSIFMFNYGLIFAMGKQMGYMEWSDSKDLIGFAEDALFNAINRFKADLGWKFSTYACLAIRRRFNRKAERLMRRYRAEISSEFPDYQHPIHTDNLDMADLETVKAEVFNTDTLTERERNIFLNRVLLGQHLHEIGGYEGISKERVRQIVDKSIEKLREKLVA